MYKALVVDDEQMIRNGIRNLIPWEQIGIDRVFTAASGNEALPIIQKERPVDEIYLTNVIKNQVTALEDDRRHLHNQKMMSRVQGIAEQIKIDKTMRDLLHGRVRVQDLDPFYREYHYHEDQAMQVAIVLPISKNNRKWEGHDDLLSISVKNMCIERFDYLNQGITFQDDDGRIIIVIFNSSSFDETIERVECLKNLMEEELDVDPKVILGSPVKGFAKMSASYNDALYLLKNSDGMHEKIIQPYGTEQRLKVFDELFQKLNKAMSISIGQPDAMIEAYATFERATVTYSLSNSLVRRYCFKMASSVYLSYLEATDKNLDNRITSLLNSLLNSNAEDTLKITKDFIEQLTSQDDENMHELISAAKRYINDNLSGNLSVSSIAESLYITPNYFSRLFKKETGEGCNDYIIRKRMSKAKSLLETTNIKTGKIAIMVGYCDINYFSLAFKKNTGMSPTEYRRHYRQLQLQQSI